MLSSPGFQEFNLLLRDKLAGLVAARADIHARIAAAVPMRTMARDFALQFLAAQEGMDALKHSLRCELALVHEFLSTFYTKVVLRFGLLNHRHDSVHMRT